MVYFPQQDCHMKVADNDVTILATYPSHINSLLPSFVTRDGSLLHQAVGGKTVIRLWWLYACFKESCPLQNFTFIVGIFAHLFMRENRKGE